MAKVKDVGINNLTNWENAIHELEFDGKPIRRHNWSKGSYLDIRADGTSLFLTLCNTNPKVQSKKYLPSNDDTAANDWETLEVPVNESRNTPIPPEHILISATANKLNAPRIKEFKSKILEVPDPEEYRRLRLEDNGILLNFYKAGGNTGNNLDALKDPRDYYEQGANLALLGQDVYIDEIEDIRTIHWVDKASGTRIATESPIMLNGAHLDTVIKGYADAIFLAFMKSYRTPIAASKDESDIPNEENEPSIKGRIYLQRESTSLLQEIEQDPKYSEIFNNGTKTNLLAFLKAWNHHGLFNSAQIKQKQKHAHIRKFAKERYGATIPDAYFKANRESKYSINKKYSKYITWIEESKNSSTTTR